MTSDTTVRIALSTRFSGGLGGTGDVSGPHLTSRFSAAPELGGPGEGTDPEELLFAAASTCLLITLGAMLARRELPVEEIELETHGEVEREPSLKITRIEHRPRLRMAADATEVQRENALEMARRAEMACMVTAALRGNVTVTVDPSIL